MSALSPQPEGARPRLLDLFCGAGGAGMGYALAGFDVVGVDINPQPNYPFEFIQADAIDVLHEVEDGCECWDALDAIHASPPCQRYSSITQVTGRSTDHPDLVAPVRESLRRIGLPYVIENVPRSPLMNWVVLCGAAMGLTIDEDGKRFVLSRHRLFECSFAVMVPGCCCRGAGEVLGVYGGGTRQDTRKRRNLKGGNTNRANKRQAALLMEMPWATRKEMTQAIPPAYTQFIGERLIETLTVPA